MDIDSVTRSAGFYFCPLEGSEGIDPFCVAAGVSNDAAISTAQLLESSAQDILHRAIQEGMDGDTAWLCKFVLETASALRSAAGEKV